MTKERFLELLNLYLDAEISLEEEKELQRELRFNPDRYALYLEYCQLNNACVAIGESFASAAVPQKRSFRQIVYATSGLAAAVALLFLAGQNLMPILTPHVVEASPVAAVVELERSKSFSPIFVMDEVLGAQFQLDTPPLGDVQLASTGVFETGSSEIFQASSPEKSEAIESLAWKKGLVISSNPSIESIDHELIFTVDNPMRLNSEYYAQPQNAFGGISERFEFDFSRVSVGDPRDFNVKLIHGSSR